MNSTVRNQTRKKWIVILLKLVVTFGLGWFLLTHADWTTIGAGLSRMPLASIVVALATMVLSVTVSAYKWGLLLKLHGVHYPFRALHRYYFIAMFFNNFLPTSIGGDGYRIYKTLGDGPTRSSSVIAIFMERLSGLAALLVIGYICAFIVFRERGDAISETILWVGTTGFLVTAVAGLLFWLFDPRGRLIRWQNRYRLVRILVEHWNDYLRQPGASTWVIVVSFLFQLLVSIATFVLLRFGVEASISIPELLVTVTIVNLIAVLPISINGIGVIDGSFVYLVGQYGVGYDAALTVMIVIRLLLIAISFVGAALFLADRAVLPKTGDIPEF